MTWTHYLPALLKGAKVTAEITLASTVLGGALVFAAGVARGGRKGGIPDRAGLHRDLSRHIAAGAALLALLRATLVGTTRYP
jgi:hypothetical protein